MASLAVIGAGVGGCSAAYFARKHFPDVKITIYEAQNRIGGRVLTKNANGVNLEIGATFFNGLNKTILDIVQTEKLSVQRVKEHSDFAVWNGSKFLFRSNKRATITNLKLLAQYKLSITRALQLLNEAKQQITKLYQEASKNPTDIDNLLASTNIKEWSAKTLDELLTQKGISRTFIDEVASPITRTIYSQNADIGGFAGISSLIGVYGGPIYSFTGGNSTFPTHLTQASHADVKQGQKVTSIEKNPQDLYRVSTTNETEIFDGVIIATPLKLSGIELDGISNPEWAPQSYLTVYKKVMQGIFNSAYFGLQESTKPPVIVLTTKEADPITHCSIQEIANKESLVTLTSTQPIADEAFKSIFKNQATPTLTHCWQTAYPIFNPTTKLPPTRLDNKLFYVNSIETSVSSMETEALSALNAIKMMKTDFTKK